MKKGIAGLAAVVAVIATAVAMSPRAAQGAQGPDVLMLRGAGSSIGAVVRDATTDDAQKAKLGDARGVVVESVGPDSPASRAGLQAGDIVVEFDSEPVRSVRQFTRLVQETPPRRSVEAVIVRGTARQTLTIAPEAGGIVSAGRLREQVRRGLPQLDTLRNFNFDFGPEILRRRDLTGGSTLGVSVTPLTPQLAEYFGVTEGVLVSSVTSGTPASEAGIRAGDVITAVGGQNVSTAPEVMAALRRVQPGDGVDIVVTRDRKPLTLRATIQARPNASGRGGLPV